VGDLETLRAHLRAHPDDGRAWLVYADWLAEQGEPLGEAIALEHRLSMEALSPGDRLALEERLEALREEHQYRWVLALPEAEDWRLAWYLRLHRGLQGRWNRGTRDTLAPSGPQPSLRFFAPWPEAPSPLAVTCERALAAVRARVERAFDGAPPPDEEHRTLYQAEASDNRDWCDRSRDHLGRWQDLPEEHLLDCQFALPHLDEQGLRYYLPAVMALGLRHLFSDDRPVLLENLSFTLGSRYDADLRDYVRSRMRLLAPEQRLAICTYCFVAEHDEAFESWARVVVAELDGPREDWFDLFWPPGT
jgi:uncharacterized protein (TIGR02996 family)